MKHEEIKIGETYYVRVKAYRNEVDGAYFQLIDENGHGNKGYRFYNSCYYAFSPTPTPPKYDPCRKFKKGDKVRVVEWNGRQSLRDGQVGVVVKNEESGGMVELAIDGWKNGVFLHACKLELVTPVEELEQLYINPIYDCDNGNQIGYEIAHADGLTEAIFYGGENNKRTLEEALTAAEAERDRLNAEHRKEKK